MICASRQKVWIPVHFNRLSSLWIMLLFSSYCVAFASPGALFSLKRKKMYEAELDKLGNTIMTLETQVMNLESAAQNAETFKAMNAGNKAIEKIQKDTPIAEYATLMDKIKEAMEHAAVISGVLAQPIDPLLTDEDDLLAELEQMSADAVLGAPVIKAQLEEEAFPTVPSKKLPAIANASEKEAEELAMLEA
jgi:charged multivesicular body protein 4